MVSDQSAWGSGQEIHGSLLHALRERSLVLMLEFARSSFICITLTTMMMLMMMLQPL
jgi:hypothetical protein